MRARRIGLALLPLAVVLAAPAGAATPLDLSGTVTGTVAVAHGPVDAGSGSALTGSGTTSLGATSVTGTFKAPGFVRGAQCSADLVLSTTKGRVEVALTPPAGASACPSRYAWKLVTSSGPYAGRSGAGLVDFAQGNGTFKAHFIAAPAPVVVPPTLPHTGLPLVAMTAIALLSLAGGGVLLALGRRRVALS